MAKIKTYDTTLRDGSQAQGISFSLEDKLLIARRLDEFGMDYVEGGFPQSNPKEVHFFEALAKTPLKHARLAAFGSTRRAGVKAEEDAGLLALLEANTPVCTIVGKCWDLHVSAVLRCSNEENLAICAESVRFLKKKGKEVIFDAEHFFDGYRANPEYAIKVLTAAAEAGAACLALCETNGGKLPDDVYEITSTVVKALPGVEIGIHCHNDTDCAVANTLAAIRAGARHIQGTVNGIGERAGNANLCTILPNVSLKMGFETVGEEKLKTLTDLSRFVFEVANMAPTANMPYVGECAFAHKGGLHIDALRKNQTTYEHLDPAAIGNTRKYLISELSGASNVMDKLEKKKMITDKAAARKILQQVQDLENEGYQFETAEASFDILIKKAMGNYRPSFELEKYHIVVERSVNGRVVTEASVKLKVDGKTEHVVCEGDGPVNALDGALRKALEPFYPNLRTMSLIDYKVRVVNAKAGTAARVRVVIESRDADDLWGTVGVSENVIEASWIALVDSVEYKLLKDAGGLGN
jgi:2-isopropylmalate synthase